MRRIVWDEPERVGRFVCDRVGGRFDPAMATAIGMEVDDVLVAGVMFDNFNGRSISMHVAGDGGHWMTRDYARACFGYAFNQLGVNKIIGLVDSSNEAARRYDEHLGFHLEATITGAGNVGDLLIYSMTPEQCRWIGRKNGQE